MKKLFKLVALVTSLLLAPMGLHAATTWNVNSSQSTSTIQGVISGSSAGDTVQFAAGTYSTNAEIAIKCGVTYTGPVITPGINGMVTQTAILASTMGQSGVIFGLASGSGYANPCTQQTTIEYLSFMNSGGIYVQSSYTNLLIQYNNFGNIPCCNGPYPQSTGLYFDGGNQGSNTAQSLTNTTIQWNTVGDSNSCLSPASAFADIISADGDGNAGGCNGMIFNTTLNGVTYVHNNIFHVSEGTHVNCPGGGNPGVGASPCEPSSNGVTIRNLTVEYNDFSNIHRMNWEQQPQTSSGVVWQFNTVHDMLDQTGFSFGMSFACCIVGAGSPYLNVSNNVVQFNTVPYGVTSSGTPTTSSSNCVGTYDGIGVTCPPRYGYGIEAWATDGNFNNNWIGVCCGYATAQGITWGYDGAQPSAQIATQNNNTICGAGFSGQYYGPEAGQSITPTQVTGNSTSSTCSPVTSVAPTISPSSGSFSGTQTVTFTDPGYTAGPQPLGNTGIWYTTDGSTPVAGSHGTYIVNGGSITSSATTIKAVGMWGAQNQTTTYATSSGLGFAPSGVVTASYTGGIPTAATPVFSPAGETILAATPVTVTSATAGAVLHCTTDGSTPTSASPVYSAPFSVASSETLSCIAIATGLANSGVGSAAYVFSAPTLVGAYLGTTGGANTMTGGSTLQFSAFCYYSNSVVDNCSTTDPYGYAVTQWITSNNGVMAIGAVGSSTPGLVLATGSGTAYIQAMIGSVTSSEWVVGVSGGNPSITIRGQVTFKGLVSPN